MGCPESAISLKCESNGTLKGLQVVIPMS